METTIVYTGYIGIIRVCINYVDSPYRSLDALLLADVLCILLLKLQDIWHG